MAYKRQTLNEKQAAELQDFRQFYNHVEEIMNTRHRNEYAALYTEKDVVLKREALMKQQAQQVQEFNRTKAAAYLQLMEKHQHE